MNQKKENNKHIIYLDILRIISTIAVIIIHISAQNWYNTSVSSFEWNVFNIFDSMFRWPVPIFVMISGTLFLDTNKIIDIKKLYQKNILRIITAFLFWSAVYSIDKVKYGINHNTLIMMFIKGPYHMWFLYMITGLYILVPILRKITISKKYTEYFLILGIIFIFIIPRTLNLLECVNLLKMNELLLFVKFLLNLKIGYPIYFVLGCYLAKYDIKPIIRTTSYILGLLSIIGTILLTIWHSNKIGAPSTVFYDNFSLNILLTSVSVFLFIKQITSKIKFSNKAINNIQKLSKYSFGIYLVHVLVIEKLHEYFNLNTLTFNPIISMFIITILVTIISGIISMITNKIPILQKYIV